MVVLLNIIIFASFISLCLINSLTPQAFIIQSSNNRREEDSVIRKVDQVRHVFSVRVEGSVCYYGRVNGVPMGRLGIRLFANHSKEREFGLGNSRAYEMPNSIRQVPNDGYGVSTSVVMNLEAEEMKKLTSMLKSHDPGDEVCINSFNDSLKHGC